MIKLHMGLLAIIILFGFSRNHANGQIIMVCGRGNSVDTTAECGMGGICLRRIPTIYTGGRLADKEFVMEFSLVGNILTGEFKTTDPEKSNIFKIEKEFSFSPDISKKLGCNSITIKAKNYIIDFSKNRLGTVKFDVRTIPIMGQTPK